MRVCYAAYLFSLPWTVCLAAYALSPHPKPSGTRGWFSGQPAIAVIVVLFLVAFFGEDGSDVMTPADMQASVFLYTRARPGPLMLLNADFPSPIGGNSVPIYLSRLLARHCVCGNHATQPGRHPVRHDGDRFLRRWGDGTRGTSWCPRVCLPTPRSTAWPRRHSAARSWPRWTVPPAGASCTAAVVRQSTNSPLAPDSHRATRGTPAPSVEIASTRTGPQSSLAVRHLYTRRWQLPAEGPPVLCELETTSRSNASRRVDVPEHLPARRGVEHMLRQVRRQAESVVVHLAAQGLGIGAMDVPDHC